MNLRIPVTTLAVVSIAAFAAAHDPHSGAQTAAPPRPDPQTPAATATVQPTTTLVGCVYRENQVPGRKPNIAERAGVLEDYILADATTSPEDPGSKGTAGTAGTSASAPASGSMYKIENIPDDRLKSLVGKRVEVKGRIDPQRRAPGPGSATGAPTADRGLSPDRINLPELEASSIREVSGTCPATPAPRG
jgi:hypothetical protein